MTNAAVANLGDATLAAQRNLIEIAGAVNDERAMHAKFGECIGDDFDEIGREDAEHLSFGSGWIGQWAQQIEDSAMRDQFARRGSVPSGGVRRGCKQKADAKFADRSRGMRERKIDADAECFEYIGRSGARARGTVAVFGNAGTGGCGDDCGGGGDVKGATGIATCAAGVHQYAGTWLARCEDGGSVAAHRSCEAGQLVDRQRTPIQGLQQFDDLGRFDAAREQLFEQRACIGPDEVATGSDVANQIVRVRHLSEMSYKPF